MGGYVASNLKAFQAESIGFNDGGQAKKAANVQLDLKAPSGGALDWMTATYDPTGVFYRSDNKTIRGIQSKADIGGYTVKADDAANAAKAQADEEKAAIAKQQALVDAEAAKQNAVINERKSRLKQNQLLSGSETGTTSLLGAK